MKYYLYILALYFLFAFLEFFFGEKFQQSAVKKRLQNLILYIIYFSIGTLTVIVLNKLISFPNKELVLLSEQGIVGIVINVFLYLFIADFIFYWYHRAQHKWEWLWSIHRLHHSDDKMNATTSIRTFWLEFPLQKYIISYPVFLVFGFSGQTLILYILVAGFLLVFSHANLKLNLGVFTKFVIGPQVHRIHHSIEKEHRNKNFAQYFPIFDILFGTYYNPNKDEFPNTGLREMKGDFSIYNSTVEPFVYLKNFVKKRIRKD